MASDAVVEAVAGTYISFRYKISQALSLYRILRERCFGSKGSANVNCVQNSWQAPAVVLLLC